LKFQFKIADWYAVSPGLCSKESWHLWAESGQRPETTEISYDLPSNMLRRMSLVSKLAVQTALKLVSKHESAFVVFASRHGELQRTYKLLNEILAGEGASPIAFSQSVHNTASGLFTIASGLKVPVSSLAAGHDTFQQGLVEAFVRLNEMREGQKLLFVCFDDIVPNIYKSYVPEGPFPYALGLVLEQGQECIIRSIERSEDRLERMPQALTFLKNITTNNKTFKIPGATCDWLWTYSD